MRDEVKFVLMTLCLGAGLVAYGHSNFATIPLVDRIFTKLDVIDKRVYEIHKAIKK